MREAGIPASFFTKNKIVKNVYTYKQKEQLYAIKDSVCVKFGDVKDFI